MERGKAPIVLFIYNRLNHIIECLNSLKMADESNKTKLIIFSDGPKTGQELAVRKVREYVKNAELKQYFYEVEINELDKNLGLAKMVIFGVDEVIKKYGKCIVVEDDVVVSRDFINFMNDCLNYYENEFNIWSIAGMSIIDPKLVKEDIYILGRICSCAWATWRNRWEKIDWDVCDYKNFRYNLIKRNKFNRYGTDRSNMLDRQMFKKIDSWAIRFDYAGFLEKSYTVYPRNSKAKDNGHDGSGTHFTEISNRLNTELLYENPKYELRTIKNVVGKYRKAFSVQYKLRFLARVKRIMYREIEGLFNKKVFY